jgi:hypothetical protein
MPTLDALLPSLTVLGFGVAALLTLYKGQHNTHEATIKNRFTSLNIIATGVKYSGWPMEFLLEEIKSTQDMVVDLQLPSLLEGVLSKGT